MLTLSLPSLTRHDRSPAPRPQGPRGESAWARSLRWIADRHRLREMDERLLRDIGLTRAEVSQGLPFRR